MCENGYHERTYADHQQDVHKLARALQKFGVEFGYARYFSIDQPNYVAFRPQRMCRNIYVE